ncbi:MAG: mechanosensitive ion channel family protein [Hyphomicrobiales bacterium]
MDELKNFWDFIDPELIAYYGIRIIVVIVILVIARFISYSYSRFLRNVSKNRNKLINPSQLNLFKIVGKGLIYFLAATSILFTFPQLRGLGAALFAGAGITAGVIAYSTKETMDNIASGILIFITKPFVIGDRIEIKGKAYGIVEEITIRHTIVRDFSNQRVLIPNKLLSNETMVNYNLTDLKTKVDITFGIGYESDHMKAMEIIAEEIRNHPSFIDIRTPEEINNNVNDITIKMVNWGESSIDLKAYTWVANPGNAFGLKCDVLKSVKERFDKEQIDIPYPHRVILNK